MKEVNPIISILVIALSVCFWLWIALNVKPDTYTYVDLDGNFGTSHYCYNTARGYGVGNMACQIGNTTISVKEYTLGGS